MLTGFKNFIMKGNVVDLAVAVVIGAAFGAVVDALVKSVLMPLISVLVGQPNFDDFLAIGDVRFGVLLTAVVNFLLVAAAIYFVIIVPMNHLIERRNRRLGINQDVKEESAEDPQIALLTEIRDALRAQSGRQP
jgi:large conductance mechanosensitive channel